MNPPAEAPKATTLPPDPLACAAAEVLTLHLHPGGQVLPARTDQTLWAALQAAGVPRPVSCRNGSCRTCIGRLLAGQVRYTVAWPGLLPEEKAAGYVLPCVACPEAAVVLAPADER